MPARGQKESRRERTRRELLRALLEEEQEAEGGAGLSEADLLHFLRELRPNRRGPSSLLSSEQLPGFIWGVGAAALLIMLMPSAKKALRPFAVSTIKSGLDLVDQLKRALGEAGEGLQDLVAEAQFERMKEAVGSEPSA